MKINLENVMFVIACLFIVYGLYTAYVFIRMYMVLEQLDKENKFKKVSNIHVGKNEKCTGTNYGSLKCSGINDNILCKRTSECINTLHTSNTICSKDEYSNIKDENKYCRPIQVECETTDDCPTKYYYDDNNMGHAMRFLCKHNNTFGFDKTCTPDVS